MHRMQLLLPKLPRLYPKDSRPIFLNSVFIRLLSTKYFDVIISGGGLVGGTMACALGSSPWFDKKKLLLLESQPQRPIGNMNPDQPFSNRVCAISPGSKRFMERLGFWKSIERKCTVKKMQIWDALSKASISFDDDDMNGDLCYIIENDLMVSSIHELLGRLTSPQNDHFEVQYGSRITTLELPRNYANNANDNIGNAQITLNNGQELECGLLIAADGANSVIPIKANMPKLSWNYDQSAVVATLKLDKPVRNVVAWQRFLPQGPIALLPLDDEHSSLVWSTSHLHAKELVSLNEEDLVKEINNAFLMVFELSTTVKLVEDNFEKLLKTAIPNQKVNPIQIPPSVAKVCGKPASFPLGMSHSNNYVKPRLALIGDTAHRIHPLAGQGANLGFRDTLCLLESLEKAIQRGSDIGCMSHLTQFEQQRQLDNVSVCIATDAIKRLYSTTSEPTVFLRSLGLMGVAATESLKEFLKKQAMN